MCACVHVCMELLGLCHPAPSWSASPLLKFGAIHVRCLLTPGHTSGHMSYFLWEDECLDPPALFSGITTLGLPIPCSDPTPSFSDPLSSFRGCTVRGWLQLASGGQHPANVPEPCGDIGHLAPADGEQVLVLRVQTLPSAVLPLE